MQTALVMALDKMKGVDGREEVLDEAVSADDEEQARFLTVGLAMLAEQHAKTSLKSIVGGKPVGITTKGRVIATMPLDYVSWNEKVSTFANRKDLLSNKPLVMVTGRLSPTARAEMEKLGWEIKEQAPLPGKS